METDPKRKLLKTIWLVFFIILSVSLIVFLWPSIPDKSVVSDWKGEVTVFGIPGENGWRPVKKNDELFPGCKLRTATKSRAEVRLNDGSLLRMNENTELEVVSVFINPMMGIRNAQWKINTVGPNGGVYVSTGHTGSVYEIQSENFSAVISSGSMRVFANDSGDRVVKVVEDNSKAVLIIGDKKMEIPSGNLAIVNKKTAVLEKAVRDSIDDENLSMDKPRLILSFTTPTVEKKIEIRGQTGSKNIVFLDDEKETQADENGDFVITINLDVGKVLHDITVVDSAGRTNTQKIELERIGQGDHVLLVTNPKSGSTTTSESIAITGTVQGSEKLTINDIPVELYGNNFKVEEKLNMGLNTFTLVSTSKSKDVKQLTIWLTRDVDKPEASLEIYYPTGTLKTSENSVTIKGITTARKITINNKTYELQSGGFSLTAQLEPGRNAIVVSAEDDAHKTTSKTVIVIRDDSGGIKPDVKLDEYPSLTNNKTVMIQGNAFQTVNLTIDGKQVKLEGNGYFIYQANLTKEGKNTFNLAAKSKDNKTITIQINIWRDTTPPDISRIRATRTMTENGGRNVLVSGVIEQNCTLYVNGKDMTPTGKGDLRSVFALLKNYEGSTVTIKAVDKAGNQSVKELSVESN